MADAVASRLRRSGVAARTVTLKIRFHDFTTITRAVTLPEPVDSAPLLARAAKALKLTQGKEPTILDTQAAALAENGDFDQAVRVQEQVVRAVADTPLAAEAQTRLELYQKKQPHRQAIAK